MTLFGVIWDILITTSRDTSTARNASHDYRLSLALMSYSNFNTSVIKIDFMVLYTVEI